MTVLVLVVGPSSHVPDGLVLPQIGHEPVLQVYGRESALELEDEQVVAGSSHGAGLREEVGAESPLVAPVEVIYLDPLVPLVPYVELRLILPPVDIDPVGDEERPPPPPLH